MTELLENVKQMRRWQKEYKKTKNTHAFFEARKFEKEVDFQLNKLQKEKPCQI